MPILLPSTVYCANRGYAWSNVPDGTSESELEELLRLASEIRPEFPAEYDFSSGIVSNGIHAAVFSFQNVPAWDSEGRASDYGAFVIFKCEDARNIDIGTLMQDGFFRTPTRTPPTEIEYRGECAARPPIDAAGKLLSGKKLTDFNPAAAGEILALYGKRSNRWIFKLEKNGLMTVESGPWRLK